MDSEFESARFALPLLAAAQAQKEITHNEALALIDGIVHPVIESAGENAPPAAAAVGQAWIVAAGASGEWAGHDDDIALMTDGGWRFVTPVAGMQAWLAGARAIFVDGAWTTPPAYGAPAGGAVIDAEARNALSTLAVALAMAGLIIAN
jgi:hypothetical protein